MTKAFRANPYVEIAAIFFIALIVRVAFNLSLESRLCHFGDAFYFLTSGSQLLGAMKSGMLTQFAAVHSQATAGVNAMMSLSLVDRILIDGPVFPSYLALVQFMVGLKPAAPHFDIYSLQIAVCNSFLNAVACVLVYQTARLAFNHKAGRIAGLLAAFYPAAIINTASCYAEPFAFFIMALFLSLVFATQLRHKNRTVTYALCAALGVSAALLMLARPAFVLLPPFIAVISILLTRKLSLPRAAATIIGVAVTLAPWLAFTGVVTGKCTLMVNRYPAYNFMAGNRLASDGWREYPCPYIPSEMKEAIPIIAKQAKEHPAEFAALEARKAIRLWGGSWNNFQMWCILPPQWQDVVHQLLLLGAVFGLSAALSMYPIRSRVGRSAVILAAVPLFHCIYLVFEPLSRYAFPAMAAVIPMAAFALSSSWTKQSRIVIATACIALSLVLVAEIGYRPERFERALSTASRSFEGAPTDGYVVVDTAAINTARVKLNGTELTEPIPMWQLLEDEDELVGALSTQSAGMSKPMNEMRQWWAYSVPSNLLKHGTNTIEATGTIFGDAPQAYGNGSAWLPSLRVASWSKAFTSIYRNEPRVYTTVTTAQTAPTSTTARLFFIAAQQPISANGSTRTSLLRAPQVVLGADPASYLITKAPLPVPAKSQRFRFTATVQAPKSETHGYASIIFTGTVNGVKKQWSSPWQPSSIIVNKAESEWCVQDNIPLDIAGAPDAAVTVLASPFSADLLFLNKRQALKRSIVVKTATMEFFPQGSFPAPDAQLVLH
jgi:hypothetical protein